MSKIILKMFCKYPFMMPKDEINKLTVLIDLIEIILIKKGAYYEQNELLEMCDDACICTWYGACVFIVTTINNNRNTEDDIILRMFSRL